MEEQREKASFFSHLIIFCSELIILMNLVYNKPKSSSCIFLSYDAAKLTNAVIAITNSFNNISHENLL